MSGLVDLTASYTSLCIKSSWAGGHTCNGQLIELSVSLIIMSGLVDLTTNYTSMCSDQKC